MRTERAARDIVTRPGSSVPGPPCVANGLVPGLKGPAGFGETASNCDFAASGEMDKQGGHRLRQGRRREDKKERKGFQLSLLLRSDSRHTTRSNFQTAAAFFSVSSVSAQGFSRHRWPQPHTSAPYRPDPWISPSRLLGAAAATPRRRPRTLRRPRAIERRRLSPPSAKLVVHAF